MTVFVAILILCGGPEGFIMKPSGNEFLFEWNSVCWICKGLECSKASFQCCLAVEPLVMDDTEGTVTAVDLCNDKQLMALTHLCRFVLGMEDEREMRRVSLKCSRSKR